MTHQIAIWPPAAQGDDLIWRISAADVAQSGSFSDWRGFERQLWITHGVGIRLTDPASRAVTVLRRDMHLDFPGERRYLCDLLEGPVRDLNIMLRRGHGTIESARLRGHQTYTLETGHSIFYCMRGSMQVLVANAPPTALAAGDSLLLQKTDADNQEKIIIDTPDPSAECIAIHLRNDSESTLPAA